MDEMALLKFVRKTLKKEETGLYSINKPNKQSFAVLKFDSVEESIQFQTVLRKEKTKLKGRRIKLKPVNKAPDAKYEKTIQSILFKKERENALRQEEPEDKDIQEIGQQPIMNRICPLHHLPYQEQLQTKKEHLSKIINSLN